MNTQRNFFLCVLIVVMAGLVFALTPGTAVRTLPSNYSPNTPFTVSILVSPATPSADYNVVYGLSEIYPSGWIVSNVDCTIISGASAGAHCQAGDFTTNQSGRIEWVFLDGYDRNLIYIITPTLGSVVSANFSGSLKTFTGVSTIATSTVGGTSSITTITNPGTAVRSLPSKYTPGNPVSVSISLKPFDRTSIYGVAETYPTGWVVSDANCLVKQTGNFCSVGNEITLKTNSIEWALSDGLERTLSYKVTPPAGTTGTKTFSMSVFDYALDINGKSITYLTDDGTFVASGDTYITSTCEDGVQNYGETGVDCGGSCSACSVTPPNNTGNGDNSGTGSSGSGPVPTSPHVLSVTIDNTSISKLVEGSEGIVSIDTHGNYLKDDSVVITVEISSGNGNEYTSTLPYTISADANTIHLEMPNKFTPTMAGYFTVTTTITNKDGTKQLTQSTTTVNVQAKEAFGSIIPQFAEQIQNSIIDALQLQYSERTTPILVISLIILGVLLGVAVVRLKKK